MEFIIAKRLAQAVIEGALHDALSVNQRDLAEARGRVSIAVNKVRVAEQALGWLLHESGPRDRCRPDGPCKLGGDTDLCRSHRPGQYCKRLTFSDCLEVLDLEAGPIRRYVHRALRQKGLAITREPWEAAHEPDQMPKLDDHARRSGRMLPAGQAAAHLQGAGRQ